MSSLSEKRKVSSKGCPAPKLMLMGNEHIAVLPSFVKQVSHQRLESFAQDSREAARSALLSLARLLLFYTNTTSALLQFVGNSPVFQHLVKNVHYWLSLLL